MRRSRKIVAATAALALGSTVLWGPPTASADTVQGTATVSCAGADAASTAVLTTLGGLVPALANLQLPIGVTSEIPTKLNPGDVGGPVSFAFSVAIDPALLSGPAAGALGSVQISASNVNGTVVVDGPTDMADLPVSNPGPLAIPLTPGATVALGSVSGDLGTITGTGDVSYALGAFSLSLTMAGLPVPINGSTTLALNLTCTGSQFAATQVKTPGAPNIAQPASVTVPGNSSTTVNVLQFATPDTDLPFPIVPGSVEVVGNPGRGTATANADGSLTYTTTQSGGTDTLRFQVCSSQNAPIPGDNEVQRFAFGSDVDSYFDDADDPADGAKKPLSFTLVFDPDGDGPEPAEETAPINTLATPILGVFSPFMPPTAADIAAALNGLPSVPDGAITVTGGPNGTDRAAPYDITFGGEFSEMDVAQLTVGTWVTWPFNEWLIALQDFIESVVGGGGAPDAPPVELPEWIDLDAGLEILNNLLSAFPQAPVLSTEIPGVAGPEFVAGTLLCSTGLLTLNLGAVAGIQQQQGAAARSGAATFTG